MTTTITDPVTLARWADYESANRRAREQYAEMPIAFYFSRYAPCIACYKRLTRAQDELCAYCRAEGTA